MTDNWMIGCICQMSHRLGAEEPRDLDRSRRGGGQDRGKVMHVLYDTIFSSIAPAFGDDSRRRGCQCFQDCLRETCS